MGVLGGWAVPYEGGTPVPGWMGPPRVGPLVVKNKGCLWDRLESQSLTFTQFESEQTMRKSTPFQLEIEFETVTLLGS